MMFKRISLHHSVKKEELEKTSRKVRKLEFLRSLQRVLLRKTLCVLHRRTFALRPTFPLFLFFNFKFPPVSMNLQLIEMRDGAELTGALEVKCCSNFLAKQLTSTTESLSGVRHYFSFCIEKVFLLKENEAFGRCSPSSFER